MPAPIQGYIPNPSPNPLANAKAGEVMPTLITLILQDYTQELTRKFGANKTSTLLAEKYHVDDFRKLAEAKKYELLLDLYAAALNVVGDKIANLDLEQSILGVTSRYGVSKGYFELLEILPPGVMEKEKLSTMGREELETEVRERTQQLEKAKSDLEKMVSQRTKEFEEEKNKSRIVLYNIFDGVFALDRSHKIIVFNKSMETFTGYAEGEVLGKDVDEYVKFLDADKNEIASSLYYPTLRVTEDKTIYKAEYITLIGKGNKEFKVGLLSNVISDPGDSSVGCIVTVHDVTEQKDLEVMKLDFVSIAAHELRTPLTAVRGYLSVLMTDLQDKEILTPDQKVYLERSYLSANRLFTLVENLLSVSRIERGNVQISREPTDWSQLLTQVVQSFMGLARERKVDLVYTPSRDPAKVLVDPIMISEVLANLLDNAVRYTPSGGSVHVFIEPRDKFIVTHVKDTGQGIPKESLPHLFTKFYRVSGVLEQGSKGTGLGLYISKEIVKLHGGEISVTSDLGAGSTFSFSVPKVEDNAR